MNEWVSAMDPPGNLGFLEPYIRNNKNPETELIWESFCCFWLLRFWENGAQSDVFYFYTFPTHLCFFLVIFCTIQKSRMSVTQFPKFLSAIPAYHGYDIYIYIISYYDIGKYFVCFFLSLQKGNSNIVFVPSRMVINTVINVNYRYLSTWLTGAILYVLCICAYVELVINTCSTNILPTNK